LQDGIFTCELTKSLKNKIAIVYLRKFALLSC